MFLYVFIFSMRICIFFVFFCVHYVLFLSYKIDTLMSGGASGAPRLLTINSIWTKTNNYIQKHAKCMQIQLKIYKNIWKYVNKYIVHPHTPATQWGEVYIASQGILGARSVWATIALWVCEGVYNIFVNVFICFYIFYVYLHIFSFLLCTLFFIFITQNWYTNEWGAPPAPLAY